MNFAHFLSGKLLLPHEIPLSEPTRYYLLRTNQLKQTPAITKTLFRKHCHRCGNNTQRLFADLPCSRCNRRHPYCRNCIQTGRTLSCDKLLIWKGDEPAWPCQDAPCTWKGSLTSHQRKASEEIKKAILYPSSELLVWAVCGAGKTEMLFEGLTEAIRQNKRICIATPRADVVRELFPRLTEAFPHTQMEALYADSPDRTDRGQFIITTAHQLIRYQQAFDVMIIDEVDAFPFHHDKTLPFLAKRACQEDATTIYLTATPRPEQKRKKIPTIFVPIRYHGKPLPVPVLQMEMTLRKKLQINKTPDSLLSFMRKRNRQRQLLIFVPTVSLTQVFAQNLQAVPDHAEDPKRKEKINQFRNKKIDVLITTTILERGVTFPSVDVVVVDAGHTVFDEAALVQIAGRAGRSPDDPKGDVLFLHQGKTEAMVAAIQQIKMMNKKGKRL